MQRQQRIGQTQSPSHGFGRIHATARDFAMQGGAGDELCDGHAEAWSQWLTIRETADVDFTCDVEHGG